MVLDKKQPIQAVFYIKTRKSLKENYRKLSKKERAKPHIYSYLMLKGMGIKLNRELAEKMDLAFIQEQKKHQKPAKNTKKIFEYLNNCFCVYFRTKHIYFPQNY